MSFLWADMVVLIHFAFILFVVGGGFLVLKRPKLWRIHLPAALWGAAIEFFGWICPLTHLENILRDGHPVSGLGFVAHYILPLIYPEGLTRRIQIALGLGVVAINVTIYLYLLMRYSKRNR